MPEAALTGERALPLVNSDGGEAKKAAPEEAMANQSPEEIHVKHIRAPDYREIPADGTLHKIVDNHLVITFYIEDSRVTAEVLKRDGDDSPNLRIAAIQEERQRLDVMAVRIQPRRFWVLPPPLPSACRKLPRGGRSR